MTGRKRGREGGVGAGDAGGGAAAPTVPPALPPAAPPAAAEDDTSGPAVFSALILGEPAAGGAAAAPALPAAAVAAASAPAFSISEAAASLLLPARVLATSTPPAAAGGDAAAAAGAPPPLPPSLRAVVAASCAPGVPDRVRAALALLFLLYPHGGLRAPRQWGTTKLNAAVAPQLALALELGGALVSWCSCAARVRVGAPPLALADEAALEDVSYALLAALLIGYGPLSVGVVYGALDTAIKAHAVTAGAEGAAAAPFAPGPLPAAALPQSPADRKALGIQLARLVSDRQCVTGEGSSAELAALSEFMPPSRLVALAEAPLFAPVRGALSTAARVRSCSYMTCDRCGGGSALCLRVVGCAPDGLPGLPFSEAAARAAASDAHAAVGFGVGSIPSYDYGCASRTVAAFTSALFFYDIASLSSTPDTAAASRCGGCSRIVARPAHDTGAVFVRDAATAAALQAAQEAELPVDVGGAGGGGVPALAPGAAGVAGLAPTAAEYVLRVLRNGRDPLVGERPGIASLFVSGGWACVVCAAAYDCCVKADSTVTGKLHARDTQGCEGVCVTCCAQKDRNLRELCSASGSVCAHFQCAPCTLQLPTLDCLRLQASLNSSSDPLPCPVCAPHPGPYADTLNAATRMRLRPGEAAAAAADSTTGGSGFELDVGVGGAASRYRSYVWAGAPAAAAGGDAALHALRTLTFGASATREGYTSSRRFFSEAQLARISREGMTLVELCSGLCSFSLAALLAGWPVAKILFVEREANLHKPLEAWTRAHAHELALGRAPEFIFLSDDVDSVTAAIAEYRAAPNAAARDAVLVANGARHRDQWLPLSSIVGPGGCHGAFAGPPCQDASGACSSGQGLEGPRGRLTLSVAHALRFFAEEPARRGDDPNASVLVMLENVKGLLRHERLTVSRALGLPAELCVSSNQGRALTKRERIFWSLVPLSFARPLPCHNKTLRDLVAHLVGVEPARIVFLHGVVAGAGGEVLAATVRTDGYASISFSPNSPPSRKWQLYWVVRGVHGEPDSPPISAPVELYARLMTFPADLSVRSLGFTPAAPAAQRTSVSDTVKLHTQHRTVGNSIVAAALKANLDGVGELDAHFAAVCGPSWTFDGFTWLPPGIEAAARGVELLKRAAKEEAAADHARRCAARLDALRRAAEEKQDAEEESGVGELDE